MFANLSACSKNLNNVDVISLSCIPQLLYNVLNAALILSGSICLVILIVSGIQFVLSGGENKQVEGARKSITWAIVGLVLVLMSYLIINLIATATGVSCILLGNC
jgi:hypothetical protein